MENSAGRHVLRGSKLGAYLARHVPRARELLCLTDCEPLALGELFERAPEAVEEISQARLGYGDPRGDERLRAAIAGLYGGISPEQVRVENGGGEAILNLLMGLLAPGDEVFVHVPAFPPLYQIPLALGCDVRRWEASPADWSLDLGWLARAITPRTRAVIVNFPHNPTGYVPSREELDALVAIARREGLYLVVDEVYRLLDFTEGGPSLLPIADVYERGVSVGSFSKAFGLPGIRTGWIATRDEHALDQQAVAKGLNTTCNGTLDQLVARLALAQRDWVLGRNRATLRENAGKLTEFLAAHGDRLHCRMPTAGPVAFPALARGESASAFCEALFEANGTLLVPSPVLDYGDRHVRIGLGRKSFGAGLARLDEFLRR